MDTAPASASSDPGHGSNGMHIMVSILVVVIVCTLFYCVYCWRWRKRNAVRRAQIERLRPLSNSDLPVMDLTSIAAATNGFSKENKLGEGGFGPVYRRGDRGEAAVGEVPAGRGGVPERGGADRQAAAQEPCEAAGVLRGEGREDARLRVPPQPEPRRLPLRRQKDRALGLEDEAEHRGGHRARPAVPPRGLVPQDRPQGPQGQQRAPRQQDEPQDLRLRHGHDLPGRGDRGHQHRSRRRNIRVHGAGVRDGGRLLGEVGCVQLRGAGAGDPQRAAQRRSVPPGAPANPHPRRMEDVERGQGGRVHGRVAGRVVRQGRGVAVLPRGAAVRAGEPRAPADHVQRRADAHRRPGAAAGARAAAAVRGPEEGPGVGPVRDDVQDAFRQRRVHHHDQATIEFLLPSSFLYVSCGSF